MNDGKAGDGDSRKDRRHGAHGGGGGRGDRRRDGNEGRARRGEGRSSKGQRRHSQRGGRNRAQSENRRYGPNRAGYREERLDLRAQEPDLPEGVNVKDLDPSIRQDLRVLSKENAEAVAKHLLVAVDLMDRDPKKALAHARAAKNRAGRVGVVREVNGIVAYKAGEWKEALSELRAARRMLGGPGLVAVMADCERGLGRPDKAIEYARSPEAKELDEDSRIELAIVVAGAYRDMKEPAKAIEVLESRHPTMSPDTESALRLSYAYADALGEAGRAEESHRWFSAVAAADVDVLTDAAERCEGLG